MSLLGRVSSQLPPGGGLMFGKSAVNYPLMVAEGTKQKEV